MAKAMYILLLISPLLLSSCIPVDDITVVWEKGFLDPEIEGHWRKLSQEYRSQDEYVSFIKEEDVYKTQTIHAAYDHMIEDYKPEAHVRCLSVNGWSVMVVNTAEVQKKLDEMSASESIDQRKESNRMPNGLQLYRIKNGLLCLYRLHADALAKSISEKIVDGTVDPNEIGGPRIRKLDMNTIVYICGLAENDENIESITEYQRVQNLQEALKESKTYPATEKTFDSTLFDVDFPELKYFAEGKTEILLNQLQASPEWEVRDKHGEIICSKRMYSNGIWQLGSNGYESTFENGIYEGSGFYQIRYLFRFSKEPYGAYAHWAKDDHVMKIGPQAGKINLKLKLYNQGIESYIAIGQENLWFEFFEQRKEEPRIHTQKALAWLKAFLVSVKNAEMEIQQNGFAKALLPKDSIREGIPSIKLQDHSNKRFSFQVNAWVNPQKSGCVYVKLFDLKNNVQLSPDTLKYVTGELVGFSKNARNLFQYSCIVSDYDNEWGQLQNARFELWFHAKDGSPEIKLIEETKVTSGARNTSAEANRF
jgi:hypothetical protein